MILVVAFAVVLGARVVPAGIVPSLFILALIVAAYIPFGIVAAAGVIAFRTAGPFPQAIITVSTLLGGVYYPTHVIPSWLEGISGLIPLTYGLRALRRSLLEGAPLASIAGDILILIAFTVLLLLVSVGVFLMAFRYARRSGTLAQY
jgi:ABC-2 type transport system permease protein